MQGRGVVFVTGDRLGDQLSGLLEAEGCQVIRGPQPNPPALTTFPEEDWPQLFGETDVMVVSPRDVCAREVMEAAPRLRGVVSAVIGVDTIDMDAANAMGLIVGHGAMPENYLGVSESTVMLIAALCLDLHGKETMLRTHAPRPPQLRARMVRGKTIGLIGMGRTARGVVERLAGWEVRLQACDPYVSQAEALAGVAMVELETLLRTSDVVSVHVTLTAETQHLLGEAELRMMRPDAYLINTARGGAVDEEALYRILRDKVIAGAAIDVFEHEPLSPDSPLRTLDNVILTPHIVGHSQELMAAIPPTAAENVLRLLRGEPPLYVKNPEILEAWQKRLALLR
ncbi:2-hydroxyacid dehydrogenase [Candidatus Entotheonella palauensis]|uniref:2-hydroxyacid dehydrogenase n=1 Tax=Candidatus Entotheonella palauensis TaxID=93172 RepID=UPI000B7F977C|nr:2-hydroxyacid dehydrogenase [Candidatus Entotheonella palauensis]